MPIDPEPDPNGTLVFFGVMEPRVRVLRAGEQWTGNRFTSHFATCPHAGTHRKPARAV
jgi:hypothetical protein